MKIIAIDNHVLYWGIRQQATPGQEDMIPRAIRFFHDCKTKGVSIMIPSIVLAEFLTAIEPAHHAVVQNMLAEAFLIPTFDSKSANIYAKLWREKKASNVIHSIKVELGATRQELKADCMIVATSIANNAVEIYSYDAKLKNFANGNIPVLELPSIPDQQSFDLDGD